MVYIWPNNELYPSKTPCPWRAVKNFGIGYSGGLIAGSLFHGFKGFRDAPSGMNKRFIGSLKEIKTRSPMLAGKFGIWFGIGTLVDCTVTQLRQKNDPWNHIISGLITGGVLTAKRGVGAMAMSAITTGAIVGLVDAIRVFIKFAVTEQKKPEAIDFRNLPEGWE